MGRLAFLEFPDEIVALERVLASDGVGLREVRIVALEPSVRVALQARGITAESTAAHLGTQAHAAMVEASEAVMDLVRERFDFTDERQVSVSYTNEVTHYVRFVVNHFLKVLEIADSVLENEEEPHIFASVRHGCSTLPMLSDDDRFCGRIIERLAAARNVRFTGISDGASDPARAAVRKRPFFLERAWAKFELSVLRSREVILLPRPSGYHEKLVERLSREYPNALFVGLDYEGPWYKAAVANMLRRLRLFAGSRVRTLKIASIEEAPSKRDLSELTHRLESLLVAMRDGFAYRGVRLGDMLAEKTATSLGAVLAGMLEDSTALFRVFEQFPRGILISCVALGRMAVAGELAKRTSYPALFVSHGSHPEPSDPIHKIELRNLGRGFMLSEYPHVAIANPVQEAHLAYFRERYDWVEAEGVVTGPLVFAEVSFGRRVPAKQALGIAPEHFVITHAVTVKNRAGERFHNVETLDEFLEDASDLVRVVSDLGDTVLVERVHPGFALSDRDFRALLPGSDRLLVNSTGSFASILAATDLLVSYSSTAIDEALANDIPVLLYDPWRRYDHFGTVPFEEASTEGTYPVCYVDREERLAGALAHLRARVEAGPDPADFAPYRYLEDYSEAFFEFIDRALSSGPDTSRKEQAK